MKEMAASSPENTIGRPKGPESAPSVVSQPVKIESNLGEQLGSFLEDINRISETASSGSGEQWSGAQGGQTSGTQGQSATVSARDRAIAAIPAPAVMQKELEKHIRQEVKQLRKQAQRIARMNRPGAAKDLNDLYAHMRRLNALLAEIFGASYDALKRLFIRVFIDRQPIL